MLLRSRLTLTIGSLVLVLGTVLAVLAMTLNTTVGRFRSLLATETELAIRSVDAHNYLLQARRAEKDFLARLQMSYAGRHSIALDGLVAEVDRISKLGLGATVLLETGDAAESGTVRTIDSVLDELRQLERAYRQSFALVVAGHQARGLTHDQGLQKEFRAAAHGVEQALAKGNRDDLSVRLLQVRRAEKDYQLRQRTDGEKYKKLTLDNCTVLEKALESADVAFAEPVRQALAVYRDTFTKLVNQDTFINQETNQSETIRALEPLLEILHENAERLAHANATSVSTYAKRTGNIAVISTVVAIIVGLTLVVVMAGSIAHPIQAVALALNRIAGNDFTVSLNSDRTDELGDMTRALNRTAIALRQVIGEVTLQSKEIDARAAEVDVVSVQVNTTAKESTAKAASAATGANEISANVATVATAAEEMTAAISEISRNVSDVANIAKDADTKAESARNQMGGLVKASDEITDALQIIRAIAEQTNLLALNATIEAARAGEAGRGFAVVAGEVKNLARQSAEATVRIDSLLQAVQTSATSANAAITEVAKVVRHIAEVQTTVAGAIEEQTATTQEIGRAVNEVNLGVAEISRAVTGVNEAATVASAAATQANGVATSLKSAAKNLAEVVARFRI